MRTSVLVAALAAGLASAHAASGTSSNHGRRSQAKRASGYTLTGHYAGQDFLDLFNYDTHSSNGGLALFATTKTASSNDLVEVKDGKVHLRVHPKAEDGKLQSVKLTSKQRYDEGLYIWDVERMPQVCGAWPAIWSTGDNWPAGGEMDLIEYVSHHSMNGQSVHTAPGCWAGSTGYTGKPMLAGSDGLNCDAEATASQGCGFRTAENGTAGIGANYGGAGVYALDWSSSGISMWFFPRNEVPGDILSKNPSPSSWKKPTLHIAESSCSPISHYFSPQQWVINTDLCGTWASGTWNSDNSYAGQSEGSCAARTGYATCAEYVENEAKDFKHAYWRIASLDIYNK